MTQCAKIGDFYASFMDEAGIEAKGVATSNPNLTQLLISATGYPGAGAGCDAPCRCQLALNNTNFHTQHLFGVWVTQGLDDPEKNHAYLLQGGLGMPDRDYYVSNHPKMAAIRKEYYRHVAAVLNLAGLADAQNRAQRIVALKSKIARVHATRVESEDVHTVMRWQKTTCPGRLPGSTGPLYLRLLS